MCANTDAAETAVTQVRLIWMSRPNATLQIFQDRLHIYSWLFVVVIQTIFSAIFVFIITEHSDVANAHKIPQFVKEKL